ncbi:MAG: hypothetical protein AAGP08_05025, partial [Pseudomonadota bacterium]
WMRQAGRCAMGYPRLEGRLRGVMGVALAAALAAATPIVTAGAPPTSDIPWRIAPLASSNATASLPDLCILPNMP